MNTSHEKSTYALLVRSEEKSRSVLETVIYVLCILSVVASIWQFAQQPVRVSAPGLAPCVACVTAPIENPHI
jgi:hypothetical protein